MPELPEVETIARALDQILRGRRIETAELLRPRLAPYTSYEAFAERLNGKIINYIHRRGKHILFDLTGDTTLLVHLRMSGRFSLLSHESEPPKFTHAVFHLDNDRRLVFDDQRHFGLMKVLDTETLFMTPELSRLAPEPFSDEFSAEYLHRTLKASTRTIKELLIDQTKICGVGNIYAAEALFLAGLHPGLRSHKISKPRARRLHEAIRAVLDEAIQYSARRPVDPEDLDNRYYSGSGESGSSEWLVYDREKQPCRNCKSPVLRLKQGGRSTYYCKTCQRR